MDDLELEASNCNEGIPVMMPPGQSGKYNGMSRAQLISELERLKSKVKTLNKRLDHNNKKKKSEQKEESKIDEIPANKNEESKIEEIPTFNNVKTIELTRESIGLSIREIKIKEVLNMNHL